MMKKLLFFFLIGSVWYTANAQVDDTRVEAMMTRRALTCDDIGYNAVCLIPALYNAHKMDTLEAVMDYTTRDCGMYEFVFTMKVLLAIKDRTFREEIKNPYKYGVNSTPQQDADFYRENIVSYLQTYKEQSEIPNHPSNNFNYIVVAYKQYYDFIKSLAASLEYIPDLSPTERFLVKYYKNPDDAMLGHLSDSVYAGSRMQQAYSGYARDGGLNVGLLAGVWSPDGALADWGIHPNLGLLVGGKTERWTYDVNFSVGFINSPNDHAVLKNDTLRSGRDFILYYLGLDGSYAALKGKKMELNVLAGIGYNGLDAWHNPNNTQDNSDKANRDKYLNTLNLNAGLGYKIYLHSINNAKLYKKSYLWVQAKYNYLNFKNAGGSDASGGAMTFSIIYGFYAKGHTQYFEEDK